MITDLIFSIKVSIKNFLVLLDYSLKIDRVSSLYRIPDSPVKPKMRIVMEYPCVQTRISP